MADKHVSVYDLPMEGLVVNVPEANYQTVRGTNSSNANESFPKRPRESVGRIWERESHYHPDFSINCSDPREDGPARVEHTFKMHQLKLGAEELKHDRLYRERRLLFLERSTNKIMQQLDSRTKSVQRRLQLRLEKEQRRAQGRAAARATQEAARNMVLTLRSSKGRVTPLRPPSTTPSALRSSPRPPSSHSPRLKAHPPHRVAFNEESEGRNIVDTNASGEERDQTVLREGGGLEVKVDGGRGKRTSSPVVTRTPRNPAEKQAQATLFLQMTHAEENAATAAKVAACRKEELQQMRMRRDAVIKAREEAKSRVRRAKRRRLASQRRAHDDEVQKEVKRQVEEGKAVDALLRETERRLVIQREAKLYKRLYTNQLGTVDTTAYLYDDDH